MIRNIILLNLILTVLFASKSFAREGRGEHVTKIKCTSVKNLADAQACFKQVGEKMPSENDANAVLVTQAPKAKSLLTEIVTAQGNGEDVDAVQSADYVAAVVQNDDEESIYYFALKNGSNVKPTAVGSVIAVVDFAYAVCPFGGEKPDFNPKFAKVKNLLLGMGENETVAGTVWLDDVTCD